jgi:hypothetical protein
MIEGGAHSIASTSFRREIFRRRLTRRTVDRISSAVLLALIRLTIGLSATRLDIVAPRTQVQPERELGRPAKKKHPLKPVPLGYVPQEEASLRVNSPEMDYTYWVKATYDSCATDHPPSTIRFVRKTSGESESETRYVGDGHVLNIISLEAGSVLAIIFELGSALEVKAYRLDKNKVSVLFERGTKFPPEFLEDAILVHTGWVPIGQRCCTAETTEIWAWTGSNYKFVRSVPYGSGYAAVAKLSFKSNKKAR